MAVAAVAVVADDDLRLDLAEHLDELLGLERQVAPDEGAGMPVGLDADHARVAPPADAAEEAVVVDAERRAGRAELAHPVAAQLVGGFGAQFVQAGGDDLALLTERAGDD